MSAAARDSGGVRSPMRVCRQEKRKRERERERERETHTHTHTHTERERKRERENRTKKTERATNTTENGQQEEHALDATTNKRETCAGCKKTNDERHVLDVRTHNMRYETCVGCTSAQRETRAGCPNAQRRDTRWILRANLTSNNI
jgi:hypothetical protein